MTSLASLLATVVTALQGSPLCHRVNVVQTELFSNDQFAFKVRAEISDELTLQVRIYYNQGHYDYSYQLFSDVPLMRWDNKEHFPSLASYPHHYHNEKGEVEPSPLTGEPSSDLLSVLEQVRQFLKGQESVLNEET